jgi:hypothetical protein
VAAEDDIATSTEFLRQLPFSTQSKPLRPRPPRVTHEVGSQLEAEPLHNARRAFSIQVKLETNLRRIPTLPHVDSGSGPIVGSVAERALAR